MTVFAGGKTGNSCYILYIFWRYVNIQQQ